MNPVLTLLALAPVASAAAATSKPAVDILAQFADAPASPGCAAGAYSHGRTIFSAAAGVADVRSGEALDADTQFNAASLAKQFTALAVAKLVEARRLGLDEEVQTYLPELPRYENPVTVRMLMNHTAGIRDLWALHLLAGSRDPASVTKEQALQMLFRQGSTNFRPGTAYGYSNGGFLLLAEIVERVSGMPFADYAKRVIFEPLGMHGTSFRENSSTSAKRRASPHLKTRTGFEVRDDYPRFSGPGGLITSVNDLARFERDISTGHKVFTAPVRRIMDSPGLLTNGRLAYTGIGGLAYGSGRVMGIRAGHYFVQHGGGGNGFQSFYARLPSRGLAVAVLCNRGDARPESIADAIIERIEGDILTDEKRSFSDLSGKYRSSELQATYAIDVTNDTLRLAILRDGSDDPVRRLELKRNSDGSFGSPAARIVFHEDFRGFSISIDRITAIDFRLSETDSGSQTNDLADAK